MASARPLTELSWDPAKEEVSFPLHLSSHSVICRVPDYVLKQAERDADGDPVALASRYFQVLVQVALEKANRQEYERDGTVLVRLMDLPRPLSGAAPRRATRHAAN